MEIINARHYWQGRYTRKDARKAIRAALSIRHFSSRHFSTYDESGLAYARRSNIITREG